MIMKSRIEDTKGFAPFDMKYARNKLPDADIAIIERLGLAITRKRGYLKYRERHHAKLAQGLDNTHDKPEMSETTATEFQSKKIDFEETKSDSCFSETSYAPSLVDGGTITIPLPPKESADGKPFECPYCFSVITISATRAWIKLVFKDLQSYICTFQPCSRSEKLYDSRREWFHHVSTAHSNELGKHSLGSGLICPLCRNASASVKQLERHLARHLEELALFALPRIEVADDGSNFDNDGHRNRTAESQGSLDSTSSNELIGNTVDDFRNRSSEASEEPRQHLLKSLQQLKDYVNSHPEEQYIEFQDRTDISIYDYYDHMKDDYNSDLALRKVLKMVGPMDGVIGDAKVSADHRPLDNQSLGRDVHNLSNMEKSSDLAEQTPPNHSDTASLPTRGNADEGSTVFRAGDHTDDSTLQPQSPSDVRMKSKQRTMHVRSNRGSKVETEPTIVSDVFGRPVLDYAQSGYPNNWRRRSLDNLSAKDLSSKNVSGLRKPGIIGGHRESIMGFQSAPTPMKRSLAADSLVYAQQTELEGAGARSLISDRENLPEFRVRRLRDEVWEENPQIVSNITRLDNSIEQAGKSHQKRPSLEFKKVPRPQQQYQKLDRGSRERERLSRITSNDEEQARLEDLPDITYISNAPTRPPTMLLVTRSLLNPTLLNHHCSIRQKKEPGIYVE